METRCELVSKGLVLDEAVLARRAYGLLVQAHRVQLPGFQPRNLGAGQRRARRERCRAMVRPDHEPLVMGSQRFQMLGSLLDRTGIATRRTGKRCVEMVLGMLELGGCRPKQRL